MTRHATAEPQQDASTLASFTLLGGLLAVILSFFAPAFAIVLALLVIVLGIIALIRVRLGRPGKGPAIVGIVLAVIALLIGAARSPDAEEGFRQAAPDPNALPATVVIADVRSPDQLVTTEGRQLHVTMMQGRTTTDPCRIGSDLATAQQLVAGQTVSVAVPDAARTDVASVVPSGFQPVVMTLANGFDYAQTWRSRAAKAWSAACVPPAVPAAAPAPAERAPTPARVDRDSSDENEDDRPATRSPATRDAPAPRTRESGGTASSGTKERTGQSGHPCRPGERDGDNDGYCGE